MIVSYMNVAKIYKYNLIQIAKIVRNELRKQQQQQSRIYVSFLLFSLCFEMS